MKLAIFGSRSLSGNKVKTKILEAIKTHCATCIVTAGEPDGVCDEARKVAKELSIPLKLHWLNAKERAAGKYHWRSLAVLNDCDYCLFVYDGQSAGTRNEIKLAIKIGRAHSCAVVPVSIAENQLEAAILALQGGK